MNTATCYISPAVYSTENENGYKLTFEIPGCAKDDVDLHIDGRTLSLRTHATHESPAGFRRAVAEFEPVNYACTIDLPDMAELSTIKASVENGLLRMDIEKRAEVKPRKIEIL